MRSGAILSSTGVGPARGRTRSRASITRASRSSSALGLLQVAQAGRVGRRHVDGEIARHRREGLDQPHIIAGAVGRIAVGADIDADDAALARARGEPRQHRRRALVVEAEPVDHALVGLEPEQARARIAGLRARGHGADLHEAEAEPQHRVRNLRVLVEAGGQADRIGEIEPEGADAEFAGIECRPRQRHEAQGLDRQCMRILRIEGPQQRAGQAVDETDHQMRLRGCVGIDPTEVCSRRPFTKLLCDKRATQGYNSYNLDLQSYAPPNSFGFAMLTHNQIWTAIDRLAARAKLTPSGLAKKAGLDPTTFNKSKRITPEGRPRWPSTESVAKALQATGTKVDAFVHLITDSGKVAIQNVPLIGFAEAGAGGYFDDGGFPVGKGWEEIAFPSVTDEHAYALEISGDSMKPAYRDGDVIVVSPAAPVRRGDRVVVKTKDDEVMVKELKRKTSKSVELKSLNAEHRDRTLPMSEVLWIARIVWASQ